MAPQLAPPGSSTYASSTLNVGDGTWDASRNSFLLPNLVGFNFATTRYNGMGNRFATLPQYHNLIRAHGIIAAIVFLGIVPAAILTARFYHGRPGWNVRVHIWLQILTVLLTTVIFVLGWFAVGPNRSLSNPHHSIGLAIYVLVLFQALGGWFVHKREKGKRRYRLPLKLMVHQWLGRGIALLGLAQIPLGLALYGSPASLFVVYTLAAFALLVIYFVLSYRDGKYEYAGHGHGHSRGRGRSVGSTTGEVVDDDRRHSHRPSAGALGAAGLAGAGLAALHRMRRRSRSPRDRHRDRSRSRSRSRRGSRVDVVGSRPPSESYISEKYSRDERDRGGTWRDRLFKIGAVAGGAALFKNMLGGGGRRRGGYDDRDSYRDGEGASVDGSEGYTNDSPSRVSRLEEGQGGPPRTPTRDYRHHPLPRDSPTGSSISDRTSLDSRGRPRPPHRDRHHKARDGVATLGALGVLRAAFKSRRDRKEQRRVEELRRREMEEERLARQGSQHRYTGDGFPRRGGLGRRGSLTSSTDNYSSVVNNNGGRHNHGSSARQYYHQGIPPAGGAGGSGIPPVPANVAPGGGYANNIANATAPLPMPEMGAAVAGHHHESSGSEAYISPGGRQHRRHRSSGLRNTTTTDTTGASGLPPPAAAGVASTSSNILPPPNPIPAATPSANSPPISVKVKYHGDEQRHVTLRRLPEQEALTEREQRRRDRHSQRRRGESLSSSVANPRDRRRRRGTSGRRHRDSESEVSEGEEKWRRVEEMERAQAEQAQRQQQSVGSGVGGVGGIPVPMPDPGQMANMSARNNAVPPPPVPMGGTVPGSIHNNPTGGVGITTTATGGLPPPPGLGGNLPPPPPIPAAGVPGGLTPGYSYGYGSGHGHGPQGQGQENISSPISMTTDPSLSGTFSAGAGNGGGDYATRRQRRRAERARQGSSIAGTAGAGVGGGGGNGGGNGGGGTSGEGRRTRNAGTVEFD